MSTIDTIKGKNCNASHKSWVASLFDTAFQIILFLHNRLAKQNSRLALSKLSGEALRDIGMTRKEANAEAEKPFWD
ncbi:MAG: DUF1127 domain-containing protein [Rhizobiaceae bacterium]